MVGDYGAIDQPLTSIRPGWSFTPAGWRSLTP